jgi:hypothetical protein
LKAKARVRLEEYKDGKWELVTGDDGAVFEEIKEISFTTGEAPTTIPVSNIEYCYPVIGQKYFYQKETSKAYIKLKRGQKYLFSPDMRQEVQITKGNEVFKQTVSYNESKNCVEYAMPEIPKDSKLGFNILSFAIAGETTEAEEKRVAVNLENDDSESGNEVSRREAQAEDLVQTDNGTSILSYEFGTSSYDTFKEKVENTKRTKAAVDYEYDETEDRHIYLYYKINGGEPFDPIEFSGNTYTGNKPMVEAIATLTDSFYMYKIYPLIYGGNFGNFTFTNRNTAIFGVPPAKAVTIMVNYLTEIEQEKYDNIVTKYFPYKYELPRIYKQDFISVRTQIANSSVSTYNKYSYFMAESFPQIWQGYYHINIKYTLPDGTKGSSATFEYYNALR